MGKSTISMVIFNSYIMNLAQGTAAVHHELDPLPQLLVATDVVLRRGTAAVDVLGPGDAVDQAHLVQLALGSVGMRSMGMDPFGDGLTQYMGGPIYNPNISWDGYKL